MVDKQGGRSGRFGWIRLIALCAFLGGLIAGAVFFAKRAYHLNEAEQAHREKLRQARHSADAARHLLGRGELPAAARELLNAYMLGDNDTGVRFLLPWLLAQLEREVAQLPHNKDVSAIAFSPDGRSLLTGSQDNLVRLWDVATGQLRLKLVGHQGAVLDGVFSSDGSRILTLSSDNTCRLWDTQHGTALATLSESAEQPWHCRFSPDGSRIVSLGKEKSAELWDGKSGQSLATLSGHEGPVQLAAFSTDGQRLVTVSGKGVLFWDAGSGRLLSALRGHTENVKDAVFSPDNSRLVTTSADQTGRLWDGKTGQLVAVLEGHSGTVYSATFTLAGGKAILTVSADGTGRLWDSHTGAPMFLPVGHPRHSQILALSRDGGRMIIRSENGALELWDRILGHMRAALSVSSTGSSTAPTADAEVAVAFSPNGRRIVTGGADGTARLWDGKTGQALFALPGHHGRVRAVAWSPDSSLVATGGADGVARIFRSHIDRYPRPIEGHLSEVTNISWSSDGKRLLTASRDGTTRIWDTANGDQLANIDGTRRSIDHAFFTPDDQRVVTVVTGGSGSAGRTPCIVHVLDSRTGQLRVAFGEQLDLGRALAVSRDAERVLTATVTKDGEGHAELHELSLQPGQASKVVAELSGHTAGVVAATFSPDGKLVATASEDRSVRVWDGRGGQFLRQMDGHEQPLRAVAFSPDSRRLLTGAGDRTARLFDAYSAVSLATFGGQVGAVRGVYFSPNGSRALTVDSGDRAWLWDTDNDHLVAALVKASNSNKGYLAMVFSPDSTRVASAGDELRIYDGQSGLALVSLDGSGGDHAEVYTAAAFNSDGSLLATGAQSGAVKLWDVHLETRPPAIVAADLSAALRNHSPEAAAN